MLNECNIGTLLKQVHQVNESQMIFSCGELNVIPLSWFPLIWGYISKYGVLKDFEGLPLIPFGSRTSITNIAVLHRQSLLIHYKDDDEDDTISLLKHLGFTVIKHLPAYVLQNDSVFKCNYMHEYKDGNLLTMLLILQSKIGQRDVISRFDAFGSKKAKLDLFQKISHSDIPMEIRPLLKSFKFIENHENQQLVSIEDCDWIPPKELPSVMPQKMVLKIQCATQKSFIEKLGGKLLNKRDFIEKFLLPEMEVKSLQRADADSMIKYILDAMPSSDLTQWQDIIERLSNIPFVKSDDGKFYRPIELFRRSDGLIELFREETGRFPEVGQRVEVLKLKKESDVSANDIRQCLEKINVMNDIQQAQSKAKCILKHIEYHKGLLSDQTLMNQMKNTPWIPCMKNRPDSYPECLTWFEETNNEINFKRPVEMVLKKNSNLVGSVRAIFHSDFEGFTVIKRINQNNQLDNQDIFDQLDNVIKEYNPKYKNEILIVLKSIYNHLQNVYEELADDHKELLRCNEWVWCEDGFVQPNKIVLKGSKLDIRPYIYTLPQDIQDSNGLLSKCGSFDTVDKEKMVDILDTLKQVHDHERLSQEALNRDRKICIEILNHLSQMTLSEADLQRISVPVRCEDTEFLLKASSQTVYCTMGGTICEEDDMEAEEEDGKVFFLHECITEDIARAFHIRSLTSKLIGAEDLGIFEEYGQHEPITRRINRILEDYGDGFAIVKELIQNADDAGATKVKFLYDERLNENKRKYLIDPGMLDFQGPALWAYNDAKFSKEDFDNIVKLSGATKEDKRDKIGKFGLGFNAVYNITDVPSFISDNQLVILDPHTTNLGNAIKNKSKPGIKVPLGPKRNRLRRFVDQLCIYDGIFGMDASFEDDYEMFDGTLFRFPLRTKMQAQLSEIKKLFYSKEEMKELIKKFAMEANRLLLFTQNICIVEFYHLHKDAENAKDIDRILHVSKSIFLPDLDRRLLKALQCPSFDIMGQSSRAVDCKAKNEPYLERFHENVVVDIDTIFESDVEQQFQKENSCTKETWFIHSSIDDKECMDMALENAQLNPVASVAVCIEESKDGKGIGLRREQGTKQGYFYCFLPLPIPNGLGVHINSTFALSKDRKSFKEMSRDDKKNDTCETIWNRKLMSGTVSSAYIGLLKQLKLFIQLKDEAVWYDIWPQQQAVDSNECRYYKDLITSFYFNVINNEEFVFPSPRTNKEWLNWGQIRIIEDSVGRKDRVIEKMMEEVFCLFEKGKTVIHIPQEILSTLKEAGLETRLSEIILSFTEFFVKVFMPNVMDCQLKEDVRDNILIFAIHQFSHDHKVCESIKAHECIPTQPTGRLKRPCDLVKPKSKAADLFEINEEVLPSNKFGQCYENLIEFGMISDDISWELLSYRAKTVNNLGASNHKAAIKRANKILQLLGEKISNKENAHTIDWKCIVFLPIKPKPSNWHRLDWKGDETERKFASAEEIYPCRFQNVVGCHKFILHENVTGWVRVKLEKLLGIRTQLTISDVIRQVDIISKCIVHCRESDARTMLPEVFDCIYRTLSEILSNSPNLKREITEGFKDKAVILTSDNTLVKSEQVALHIKYDARPYLYKPPDELAREHYEILTVLNVKAKFCMEDYQRALLAMKEDAKGNPINESQLTTVRDLLESINKESAPYPKNIVLPAKDKVLWPIEKIIVKEGLWMKDDPSKRYLHQHIPSNVALALGAKTERSHSIASQSRGLPFGQSEKLTVRLKRILEAYPSQIQILYELLQNADDAGASQVKFILDKRHHPDKKVFGDAWKPLQGPALLVFNDAPFTQCDIEGIQNLGEGSKSDDCQKTGQYGIGFNVVYHVTDAPCLLTKVDDDCRLCVFDPHACFLEECSESEPGRMFEDARDYLKNTFPDIYNTFLPELLKNEESAILRLPLRSPYLSQKSSIKDKATTLLDIMSMFESFKGKGPEAIVFLRNVRSVEIYVIDYSLPPQKVCSVKAKFESKDMTALSLFNEDFKSLSQCIRNHSESKRNYHPLQCNITLGIEGESANEWKIIQKCASINSQDLQPCLNEQYKDGKLPLIPVGGIACKTDGGQTNGKVYCLLPLAVSSSLPIHINGKFILDYESRRRLWYTAEESFQKVWNYYVIQSCIIPCYVELMRFLADEKRFTFCNADPRKLLQQAFEINGKHPKEIDDYFSYIPKLEENEKAHEYDADLIKAFYNKLAIETVYVMPVLRISSNKLKIEFCPPYMAEKQFNFVNFSKEDIFIKKNASKVCIALTEIGMNIYNIPENIVRSFRDSKVPLKQLTPQVVTNFLTNNSQNVMGDREEVPLHESIYKEMSTIKALLQYCMKDENFQLSGMPLLVTEDNMLRRFDDSKHVYYDEISILFPSKKNISLHPELRPTLSKYKDKKSGALRKFMFDDLAPFLDEEVNSKFKMKDEVEIFDMKTLHREFPNHQWLSKIWNFLRKRFEEWKQEHVMKEKERVLNQRKLHFLFRGSNPKCRTPEEMGITPNTFLKTISHWCLFPIERHTQSISAPKKYFLIPINKASMAVVNNGMIEYIVQELGLPVPSSWLLNSIESSLLSINNSAFVGNATTSQFLMEMATSTDNTNAFIDALTYEYQREHSGFSHLSTLTAKHLLGFFNCKTKDIDWQREQSLKNLPVWEDLSGNLKTVFSVNKVFLIRDAMPKNGTSLLQDNHSVTFLKEHYDLKQLYKCIGLETQDDSMVYKNFILKHFCELKPEERFAHLSYLKNKYLLSSKLDLGLLEVLKSTRIIEKNGELSLARDFYHPEIKLFTVMLPSTDFPSGEYKEFKWLEFLKYLGLIWKVTPDIFCSYASRIAEIEQDEEKRYKSSVLIDHLRDSDDLRKDKSFLSQLSSIPFLVADKLHPKFSRIFPERQKSTLCFAGAVMHSDTNIKLSWTVEHIIPSYATDIMLSSNLPYEDLSVKQNVTYHSVVRNLENISNSNLLHMVGKSVKSYSDGDEFQNIIEAAYTFLSKLQNMDEDTISVLRRIQVIVIKSHNMICEASKVTMEAEFNMPPFLFSMPIELGQFVDLFKKIGISEKPTICQLTKVLQGLFVRSNGNHLHPNEARNTIKVIRRIMDITDENEFPTDIALFPLPGVEGNEMTTVSLYESQDLVFYDDAHLDKRLNKLGRPRLHLDFMREQLASQREHISQTAISRFINKLPLTLQPMKLSSIVKEEMIDAETIPNQGFTKDLQCVMNCREFESCMIRLLKHQDDGKLDDGKRNFQKTMELLSRIKVITKEKVQTVLLFTSDDMRIEESECEKNVSVKYQDEMLQIFVSSRLSRGNETIAAVATALVSYFKSYFTDPTVVPHVNALLDMDPMKMHGYLDKQGIRRDSEDTIWLSGRFYSPGGYVPIELHCLLINDISKFDVGDYVAYEVEDPGLDDKDGDPVYIYAKIVECITEGEDKDFYKIDIGTDEPKMVHKSELYGFYRPEMLGEDIEEEHLSLEEVKERIRRDLEDAFMQGEKYAKKVIKRLWLKWHPDKNIGKELFCTEVFKFIQKEAERLRGESNDSFWSFEGSSFSRYGQRGNKFNQQRRDFYKRGRQGYSWSSGYWKASGETKNPQPGEARRWYRQAGYDLFAAKSDLPERNYEWVCFKCHQVSSHFHTFAKSCLFHLFLQF